MEEKEKINPESWIRTNSKIISIRALENEIGCPNHTIYKVVAGRSLPKKWIAKTVEAILKIKNS